MSHLSVKVNKIALLRNSRGRNFPGLFAFSARFLDMGAAALRPHAASQLWTRHVSAQPDEAHSMQLREGHRLQPTVSGPDWLAGFDAVSSEHPAQQGRVAAFLSSHFHAAGAAPVFFMASQVRAYALTPAALAACWPCLLAISDEGPSAVPACHGQVRLATATWGAGGWREEVRAQFLSGDYISTHQLSKVSSSSSSRLT